MGFADRENKRSNVVSKMIGDPEPEVKKTSEKKKSNLVQKGYYLTPEIAAMVKVRAAMDGKKDYQIVQEALEAYFEVARGIHEI